MGTIWRNGRDGNYVQSNTIPIRYLATESVAAFLECSNIRDQLRLDVIVVKELREDIELSFQELICVVHLSTSVVVIVCNIIPPSS